MHPAIQILQQTLPPNTLLTDRDSCMYYGVDWTKRLPPNPLAVARPASTQEVIHIVQTCYEHDLPMVPSGGRTGLSGGAIAAHQELVISLERMREMQPIDTLGSTVHVQAGVTTQALHDYVAQAGLFWPVDFASKGQSQVGGNIATNAGGIRVIQYGMTRNWVLGLHVVLPNGTLLRLNGALEKNNVGSDLKQLFIGSEGIFGVITEATLKLVRLPAESTVCLLALNSMNDVCALLEKARSCLSSLSAFEFLDASSLRYVMMHRQLAKPFGQDYAFYVVLESQHAHDVESFLEHVLENNMIQDGIISASTAQAQTLWQYREGISESLSASAKLHKNDVAVPVAHVHACIQDLYQLYARSYPGLELCLFGHVGDGNIHVNVLKPQDMPEAMFREQAQEADVDVLQTILTYQGTMSAEHGIGLLKKEVFGRMMPPEYIQTLRMLKQTFDPKGLMNPYKVLP